MFPLENYHIHWLPMSYFGIYADLLGQLETKYTDPLTRLTGWDENGR